MRLLLDTNALLWSLDTPQRLQPATRKALEDPANDVFVSAASVYEIGLKSTLGKLRLREDLLRDLVRVPVEPLAVTWAHGLEAGSLPLHHRDPFDRLLIGQARIEGLTIVTRDPAFDAYQVAILPA